MLEIKISIYLPFMNLRFFLSCTCVYVLIEELNIRTCVCVLIKKFNLCIQRTASFLLYLQQTSS